MTLECSLHHFILFKNEVGTLPYTILPFASEDHSFKMLLRLNRSGIDLKCNSLYIDLLQFDERCFLNITQVEMRKWCISKKLSRFLDDTVFRIRFSSGKLFNDWNNSTSELKLHEFTSANPFQNSGGEIDNIHPRRQVNSRDHFYLHEFILHGRIFKIG